MSIGLDPDQDQQKVGPDFGPNCLQRYQQMTKVAAKRKESMLKHHRCHLEKNISV